MVNGVWIRGAFDKQASCRTCCVIEAWWVVKDALNIAIIRMDQAIIARVFRQLEGQNSS